MSSTPSTGAATARQTRDLINSTTARFTGKKRGADRQVRRHSYDVDDPRAKVSRPIGDGTTRGALRWIDALVRTAKEYDLVHKKPGERGPLTPYGIRVLEELLRLPDFKTGRLDPAYDYLQKVTGFGRATIARALARLKAHGFLDWVRRSVKTEADGEWAPQRKQTSNAYFFDLGRLAAAVRHRFRQLLAKREAAARVRGDLPTLQAPPPPGTPALPADPALADALARVGALVESASS